MSASVYLLCIWKYLHHRGGCLPISHGLSAQARVSLFIITNGLTAFRLHDKVVLILHVWGESP